MSVGVRKYVFSRFSAENDLPDVAFVLGKTKSRPKTFQTPENAILSLSEADGFENIFMSL